MGVADIIPGVSGGTIALITGIYDQLIDAIRSIDGMALRKLLRFDIPGFIEHVHIKFLVTLLLGIGSAILCMARLINHFMLEYPIQVWSLFFGLIAASVFVVAHRIERFTFATGISCALATIAAFLLVGMIPVRTPETAWFVFCCGAIAICAMILPGISGAFILLMLGKYEYITGALKNPFALDNFLVIVVFLAGALVGIIVFSRILHYLLHRWHSITVSVLTGFMLGAMRKVWPWKEVLDFSIVRGKVHVLQECNVLPVVNAELYVALALMFCGAMAVFFLERISQKS